MVMMTALWHNYCLPDKQGGYSNGLISTADYFPGLRTSFPCLVVVVAS